MKELPNKDKLHSMYVREEMSISTISCLTGHAQLTIKKLSQDLSWITNDVFDSAIWSRIVQDKINEIIDRINNLDDRKKK